MNAQSRRFIAVNGLQWNGGSMEDIIQANLSLIDRKASGEGVKLPLGNGLEPVLARLDSPLFADVTIPTAVFTTLTLKQLHDPVPRWSYYLLKDDTLKIQALFSTRITLSWLILHMLSRPSRAISKATTLIYEERMYLIGHKNGQLLAKALITNTSPSILALL